MVNLEKRCPTGIPGLDELIEGGFPRGRTILVSGTCGTGKTTFGVQFLYNGIKEYNEPGILVLLEESPKELKEDMLKFGMDLEKYEEEGKLSLISPLETEINLMDLSMSLPFKAKEIKAKRAVVDNLTAISFVEGIENKQNAQKVIMSLNKMAKEANLTSIFLTEIPEGSEMISQHGVESHIADGVIKLTLHESMDLRKVEIRKMRGTKHSIKSREFEFTERGIAVLS